MRFEFISLGVAFFATFTAAHDADVLADMEARHSLLRREVPQPHQFHEQDQREKHEDTHKHVQKIERQAQWAERIERDQKRTSGNSSSAACTKKQVLMVIDMQIDYSIKASMELYGGEVKNPYAGNMTDARAAIVTLIGARSWDLVVFTGDWLPKEQFAAGNEFCVRDTDGAGVIPELKNAVKGEQIFYTKNKNDAFNELQPFSHWKLKHQDFKSTAGQIPYPDRHYDLANAYGGKTLKQVLVDKGFTPATTEITTCGTAADMCVLTSSIHAKQDGFLVNTVGPATFGDVGKNQRWGIPAPEVVDAQMADWKDKIHLEQASAGRENAFKYMTKAGVNVADTLPACT